LAEAREYRLSDHVIEYAGGKVGSIKTGFREACKRAGLLGVTPHVLRHTAASWMLQGGVPVGEVARYLGDTEAMVERVYGHHRPDYLRRAADVLAQSGAETQKPAS
jgi:integrase